MDCLICTEHFDTDMLNHIRLFHPDVLDQKTERELMSLKPVTVEMHNDDHVCERCDQQFVVGMFFGETFEGMFHGYPIVSLVCGDCFMVVV
jgi:hypothetical protein